MCFSAPVSFSLSVILASIGSYLCLKLKRKNFLFLALIPFLFALQQFSEGVLWLYISDVAKQLPALIAKNIYLSFAYVVWPIWVPLALIKIEKNTTRKHWLYFLLGIGVILGIFFMIIIPHIKAFPYCSSINYIFELPQSFKNDSSFVLILNYVGLGLYVISTVVPIFVSSLKKIWILGVIVLTFAIGIYLIDQYLFVSMWCFFAAVISLMMFYYIPKRKFQDW